LGYEQCFDVSYSELSNSVSTNIIIQNPGQTYTMQVAGSSSYTVLVNGGSTDYNFESTATQEIEIPLSVGTNVISIIGNLDCSSQEDLTFVPDDNFEQALIDLGYDDVLDDYVLTDNIANLTELELISKFDDPIEDLTGLENFVALETLHCDSCANEHLDTSTLVNLRNLTWDFASSLKSVNITNNSKLEFLAIVLTNVAEIDISQNTELIDLILLENRLTSIDFSNNPKMISALLTYQTPPF